MDLQFYLFPGAADDCVLRDLTLFREQSDQQAGLRACRALIAYAVANNRRGDALRQYVAEALLRTPDAGRLIADETLAAPYLEHDLRRFHAAYLDCDWKAHCAANDVLPFPVREQGDEAPDWLRPIAEAPDAPALLDAVRLFYRRYAECDEARFEAFRWQDGALQGIERPERQRFESLAGLEHQKAALIQNAEAFLDGRPAQNVLLVGSSGTGKSSCVKATLTAFAPRGLRLVELSRRHADQLPQLLDALRDRRRHTIVFIDDLSFEEVDAGYKALKVALEGQMEARPPHVLLYVTSNRRNLVRETWGERGDEEIHENDTLHEKRSLSERFGLRLSFGILSQKEYFAAVHLLLAERDIDFDDRVAAAANTWALEAGGRSGRCAKQFVESWLARHSTNNSASTVDAHEGGPTACK